SAVRHYAAADISRRRDELDALDCSAETVQIAGHALLEGRVTRKRNDRDLVLFRADHRFDKGNGSRLFLRQRALLRGAGVDQDRKAERQIDLTRKRADLLLGAVLKGLDLVGLEISTQAAVLALGRKKHVVRLGLDPQDLFVLVGRRGGFRS